jgi:pantoate kinase
MSAAGAVATGLAVAQVLRLPVGRAWETAHLAELFHRGGLGGVAAIGGGGLEHRIRPGVPPFGLVLHRPCAPVLDLVEIGSPIPSPSVLGDTLRLARIRGAGLRSERAFARRPTLSAFLRESERFTDYVGLAPPSVKAALQALRGTGRPAAQAMFGQVLFVVTPRKTDFPWPEFRGPVRRMRVSVGRGGARRVPAGVGSIFGGMAPTARWVGSRY